MSVGLGTPLILAGLLAQAAPSTPAPSAPSPYPATEVVAAFAHGCAAVRDLPATQAALTGAGWARYTPADGTPMARLLAFARAAMARDAGGVRMVDGGTFRRTVAGEALEVALSRVEVAGNWVNGCRVFDFGETRALPAAAVTARVGRAPGQSVADPALTKSVWEPGYAPGQMNTELYFVPPGSPAEALLQSNGIVLVAQAMGELE